MLVTGQLSVECY